MPIAKHTWFSRNYPRGESPSDLLGTIYCEGLRESHGVSIYLNPRDVDACCAHVNPHPYASGQCSRRGRLVFEGRKFCGLHHPPAVLAKRQARERKYDFEDRKRDYTYALGAWERTRVRAFEAALVEIAAGKLDDPAGYAQIVIEEQESKRPEPPTESS